MSKKIVLLFLIVLLTGCQNYSSKTSKDLIGEYELCVGSNQVVKNDFLSSNLLLKENGNFVLTCISKNGQQHIISDKWSYDDRYQTINLSDFVDCAGALPSSVNNTSINLSVKFYKKPVLLLSPDNNIFYEKK